MVDPRWPNTSGFISRLWSYWCFSIILSSTVSSCFNAHFSWLHNSLTEFNEKWKKKKRSPLLRQWLSAKLQWSLRSRGVWGPTPSDVFATCDSGLKMTTGCCFKKKKLNPELPSGSVQIPVSISAQRAVEQSSGRMKEEREKASLSTRRKTKVKPSLVDTRGMVVLHVTHSDCQPGRAAMRHRGLLLSAASPWKKKKNTATTTTSENKLK